MPTYARAHTSLSQSIDSVLSQSFGDFEFIIVDDGSRDGTADVLADYVRMDSRIVVHSYHRNSGLPALRVNQAALQARGDFIAYQFDDDRWTDGSLKVRVDELAKAGRPAVVYGNAEVNRLSPDGTHIQETIKLGGEFNYGALADENCIANNAIIHHRQLFQLAGMYDPHVILRRLSDYDLWLRFSKCADFIWVDETVSNVTANRDNSLGKEIRFYYTLYRKALSQRRNHLLTPDEIQNYDVIDIASLSNVLDDREIEDYRRNIVVPFLSNFNDYCDLDKLSVAAGLREPRLNLLTIKPSYSTSIDVTINNFVNLPFQRAVANIFVPERHLSSVDLESIDIAIFYRTLGDLEKPLMASNGDKVPVVYLMDDNMLHFHEVGTVHSSLKPGTQAYGNIVRQISAADACIGYSAPVIEDFQKLNRKTIRLDTNIRRKYVVPRAYSRGGKLRIAVLSGPVRAEILKVLWPALTRFVERHADAVEVHFWGIDPESYSPLACDVYFKPFNHNYEKYLSDLHQMSFDVVLAPLDHSTRAARSKSPIKLLEALAAGAICVFSDASPYSEISGDCALKVPNTVEAWHSALEKVLDMGPDGRSRMLECARALVAERYTTEAGFYDFVAAYEAVRLHAKLDAKAILFVFHETALGGATLHLLHHARMARSLGFDVVGLVPENDPYLQTFAPRWNEATNNAPFVTATGPHAFEWDEEGNYFQRPVSKEDHAASINIASLLAQFDIGLLHFATWSPTMTALAQKLAIPSVASVHQYYPCLGQARIRFADAIHCSSLTHGVRWEELSGQPVRRIICPVGENYYRLFKNNRDRLSRADDKPFRILVSGTLQPRKNQFAVIQAVKRLKQLGHDVVVDIIGYTEFAPGYFDECRKAVEDSGLGQEVRFHGFVDDPLPFYAHVDLLVVASFDESMPQTIIQAMAAGIPVVSTNVGGVKEILRPRYTGLLSRGTEPDDIADAVADWLSMSIERRLEMIDRAQRTAQFLARPSYVKFELMNLYNEAFAEFGLSAQVDNKVIPRSSNKTAEHFSAMLKTSPGIWAVASLLGKENLWANISPDLEEIRKFSRKHFHSPARTRVISSDDLRGIPHREYKIPFKLRALNKVSIVLDCADPSAAGLIGIEVVSSSLEIIAQEVLPLDAVVSRLPTDFILANPIMGLDEGWCLRIFEMDAEAAVSVYEIKGKKTPVPFVCFQ
jgi:glycosyltransferase involved in cell wall biosynthesis